MPRILFLDAYDSFANNIVALLKSSTGAEVEVIKIDDTRFQDLQIFESYVHRYDAVVAGPGPGTPDNPADVGLIVKLWHLDQPPPVLGICLGFQSLAIAHGASIRRLNEPRHGVISKIIHRGLEGKDVLVIEATQYHSLHVDIGHPIQKTGIISDSADLWLPTENCPSLMPLAWDVDDIENGMILMAAKHSYLPFWGVQYHPESICTSKEGANVVTDWWRAVTRLKKRRYSEQLMMNKLTTLPDVAVTEIESGSNCAEKRPTRRLDANQDILLSGSVSEAISAILPHSSLHGAVQWKILPSQNFEVDDVVSLFGLDKGEAIVLETPRATRIGGRVQTGCAHSIIGCFNSSDGLKIQYYTGLRKVEILQGHALVDNFYVDDIWNWLHTLTTALSCQGGNPSVPFWGGLMGYVTYEAGLETIDVPPSRFHPYRPDICFAFVTRSIVIDHQSRTLIVQSVKQNDYHWVASATCRLLAAVKNANLDHDGSVKVLDLRPQLQSLSSPTRMIYQDKVLACQELIRAGESYELCLTDQTQVSALRPTDRSEYWQMYRRLRNLNPAPFAAYLRLGHDGRGVHVLSSSPERFLSWSRDGRCQLRPIKGTVRKGPSVDLDVAKSILGSTKEMAENLMIVDLVRHDLHGVLGPGNVRVPKLMVVEEYETVYQLVSVIEGDLSGAGFHASTDAKDESDFKSQTSGIEVLAASLPPGSMTGAPKKRSCELLQSIENGHPRGIYSGVIGYLDVGGGGDFSVVIRTAVKWDDETHFTEFDGNNVELDVWHVGAGGAVTAKSTPEGEFEEMMTKRESTLRLFTH